MGSEHSSQPPLCTPVQQGPRPSFAPVCGSLDRMAREAMTQFGQRSAHGGSTRCLSERPVPERTHGATCCSLCLCAGSQPGQWSQGAQGTASADVSLRDSFIHSACALVGLPMAPGPKDHYPRGLAPSCFPRRLLLSPGQPEPHTDVAENTRGPT